MNKDTNNISEEKLTEVCFGTPKLSNEYTKEKVRRKLLAKTDKTYLNYPYILIQTEEIVGYPYKGWSKEEIEEAINNPNKIL